jgi:DNA polymerase elongation subunit (family B)
MKENKPMILYVDLETSPILGYVWRAYEDNLLSIEKDFGLICFAYAWNDGPVQVVSTSTGSERKVTKTLWKLYNEADIIVAQNGDRFDIKVSNALFLRYDLEPPAPYKTVDTLKLAKRYFKFSKNNLDHLAFTLFGESKHETDKSLWLKCMNGDAKAMKKMELYCGQDVVLLRKLYKKLRAWHTGHPNMNLYTENTHMCPVCNGKTQRRGFMYTRVGKYQRYQCQSCGAWSKGAKINKDKVIS